MQEKKLSLWRCWQDSLAILLPANLKLLLLVTVKASLETYKLTIRYFWWLFLICIAFDILYIFPELFFAKILPLTTYSYLSYILLAFWFILWSLMGFVTFLAIRPSIDKKDIAYFTKYFRYFFCFIFYTAMIWKSRNIIEPWYEKFNLLFIILTIFILGFFGITLHTASTVYLSPLLQFLVFLMFDSLQPYKDFFNSFGRAIKMVIYNYPWCLLFFWVSLGLFLLIRSWIIYPILYAGLHFFVHNNIIIMQLAEDITKIFLVIPFCLGGIFYTKKIHEQCSLYF